MQFFGKRGQAFFDAWSIIHLAFWIVIGGNMEQLDWPHVVRWPAILLGAYVWEILESWLDEKTQLKMTKEGWINRWVSDPVIALVGAFLGMLVIGT